MEHAVIGGEGIFMTIEGGKKYTIADIEALPEGERAELIDGEMFIMATSTWKHQDLLAWMTYVIKRHIMENKGKCRIVPAPFAVYIKKDQYNYVEPDITVVCDRDKLDNKGCHGAPDWTVEIVSPSSKHMDRVRKLTLYREAGVRLYWIVDPVHVNVTVYDPEHDSDPKVYSFTDRVEVGIYEDFAIDFNEYLEELREFEAGGE